MANILTYQDLFPSSTSMQQWPGNGTITVPGAGDARLVAPNSVNCDFWSGVWNAPVLYDYLDKMWQQQQPSMPFYLEARMSAFTGTTTNRAAGLTIFTNFGTQASFYAYHFTYYRAYSRIQVEFTYPNSGTVLFYSGAVADPASTPHIYRIYWNPYNRPLYLKELNTTIQADTVLFAYSVDGGTTWVSLGTRTRDFTFNSAFAGVFCKKWDASAVNAQADFSYFQAYEYNAANQLALPADSIPGRNPAEDRVAFEDAYAIKSQSGPVRFDASIDAIGGPVVLNEGQPRVAFEDDYRLLTTGPGKRFDYPQLGEDLPLRKDVLAFEDSLFCQLDATDYIKGKNDSAGRELLGDRAIRHLCYYDSSLEPFSVCGAGFYGAGRDGVNRYDGVACGPGAFSVGSPVALNRTAWSGPDGYLDTTGVAGAASVSYPTAGTIQVAPTTQGVGFRTSNRWFLTGDFDIQINYQIVTAGSGGTDGGIIFEAYMDPNNYAGVRRKMFSSNLYDAYVKNNGSWGSNPSAATSDTSGKLRLTRVGAVIAAYYWNGTSWTQLGTGFTMTYTRPVWVNVGHWFSATPTSTVYQVSGWQINSGTTTNLAGWAREAAGTYRGAQAAFPVHAVVVASGDSIDIIDADTDLLWMSFRGAVNNAVWGPSSSWYVRHVSMRDGVLIASLVNSGGYALIIDFTLDFMIVAQISTGGGGYYNVELTTGVWPRDSANGCIAFRNSGRTFSSPSASAWYLPSGYVRWADLLHDSGYQYRIYATDAGVMVQRAVRWKYEGAADANLNTPIKGLSTQTGTMKWAAFTSNKALLYHNRTYLYVVNWATWNSVMTGGGGTWLEDASYGLPGSWDAGNSRNAEAQDALALSGNYLYRACKEGVYRINWTDGTSVWLYGAVGSAATYPILPPNAQAFSVLVTADGTVPLLVVGLSYPDQTVAVNLNDNTLYWIGVQDDTHAALSLAVGAI